MGNFTKMDSAYHRCLYRGQISFKSLYEIIDSGHYLIDVDGVPFAHPKNEIVELAKITKHWSSYERFGLVIFYLYMTYLGENIIKSHFARLTEILNVFAIIRKDK